MRAVIRSGAWHGLPPASADRRLAGCVVVSLIVHLLLVADWGFDGGRRPVQAPTTLTARLLPAEAELASASYGSADLPAAESRPPVLPAEPARLPLPSPVEYDAPPSPMAVPAPVAPWVSPAPAVAVAAPVPPAPPAVAAVAATPAAPLAPATEVPATAPAGGVEGPGTSDPTWYSGRDLDVLPRPLAPIEPPFPINALLRGVSGKVTLAVSIDAAGRVVAVDVMAADPAGFFEEAARSAFQAARYAPGIKDGRAVHARLQTVVVFELGPR